MTVHESLVDLVGGTPLVRLGRSAADVPARVYAKLEYLNPGGSVKDRAALAMIDDAERSGALGPGGTIVEGTSGNTGLGLAQVGAARGHHMIFVLPSVTAVEKVDALRAYGAEIVLTRPDLPRQHPDHVRTLAERIAKETPGGWLADQYENPSNPEVHRRTTGPEIWADTGGTVTHFVAGIGTGGTISGTGSYLREVSGGRVEVIGADPLSSAYGGGDGSPFAVEASGHYRHPDTDPDVWPASYDRAAVDRIERIADRESVLLTRRLAREEGLLVGGSSGLAVAAALRVARDLGPEHTVVTVLPDSGRAYLSKYHSIDWLRRTGFLDDDRPGLLAATDVATGVHTVVVGTPRSSARDLLDGPARHQPVLPVVQRDRDPRLPPAAGEILGGPTRAELAGDGVVTVPDGPAIATVGTGDTPAEALARLDAAGADVAYVLRDARLAGIVTRARLEHLARLVQAM